MLLSVPINQYRVFIVEDDADDWDFLKDAFAKSGGAEELHHFFTYEALFHYMDTLSDDKLPHLIILDNQVQGVNGLMAIDTIKLNPRLVTLKLALYSSCMQDRTKADYMQHGVNLCLEKGITLQAMQEHVSKFRDLMEAAQKA
jgi:CheY-like chemotaxis protein